MLALGGKVLAALAPLARDWRAWGVVVVLGLCGALWLTSTQRDAARAAVVVEADARAEVEAALKAAEQGRQTALMDKEAAESALAVYAIQSAQAFQGQAELSQRLADQVSELNRRVRATEQEIARADPSLRLDDRLPGSVRDGLACAGGDATACAAAPADPGRVPGQPAQSGRVAGASGRGADGA